MRNFIEYLVLVFISLLLLAFAVTMNTHHRPEPFNVGPTIETYPK